MLFLFTFLALCETASTAIAELLPSKTLMARWRPGRTGDENSPYFVGYFWTGSSYLLYDCDPGTSFTVIGNAAGCVSATSASVAIATTCVDNSILVGSPAYGTSTCTGNGYTEGCITGLIYENLDGLTPPLTMLICASHATTFTIYRTTTHSMGVPSSPATTTSTQIETIDPTSPRSLYASTPPSSTSIPSSASSSSTALALSQSDKIAICIGLGIGIPTIAITFCAWWFPQRARRRRTVGLLVRDVTTSRSRSPGSDDHPSERSGGLGKNGNTGVEEERIVTDGEPNEPTRTTELSVDQLERQDRPRDIEGM
ncbi:hypothetical protein BGZ57DRAFT_1004170 [Hyaloscypha finlandica]|nr:hypothetical protein BGZ57DRAFT_1004170 [Hyaloscypha finlandica]